MLGVLLLMAAVGELLVRVAYRADWDPELIEASMGEVGLGKHRRLSEHLGIFFEAKPHLDVRFGGQPVHTDAAGRRVPDVPWPGDEAVTGQPFTLHVVGDSTPFGWKVTYAESYPELVRRRLQQLWKRPVQLVNHAVPGYNAEQEEHVLSARVLPMEPDFVLWHYDHNDSSPVLAFGEKLGLPPNHGSNPLGSALIKVLWRALTRARLADELYETTEHERWLKYIISGPLYDRHLAAVRRSLGRLREAGIPTLVVVFDPDALAEGLPDEHIERLHAPLMPTLEATGTPILELHPLLRAEATRRGEGHLRNAFWLEIPDDPHPNPEGHRFLAQAVTRAILEHEGLDQ